MKTVTISVFLLSFLLSIAAALKCYNCHAMNSNVCDQKIVECPKGEQCITVYEEYRCNGTYYSISKGCSRKIPCDVNPFGKAKDLYWGYSIKCCDEDYCNSGFHEMPAEEEPTGMYCPVCVEFGTTKECNCKEVMRCHQDQHCVTFAGVARKPDGVMATYSLKGCLSNITCGFDLSHLVGLQIIKKEMFDCSNIPAHSPCDDVVLIS